MCSHAAVTTLAKTSTSTRLAPALNSALEAALAVAPEVKTSSTSTTLRSRTTTLSAIWNAPWTFSALCCRLKPTWLRVALTRRSAAKLHGFPVWRETSVASAAAWLNCRRHSRRACSGTGARMSASARMSTPARAIQLAIGRERSAVGIFEPMHKRAGRPILELRDRPGAAERQRIGHRLRRDEPLAEILLERRAEALAKGSLDEAHRAPAARAERAVPLRGGAAGKTRRRIERIKRGV